MTVITTGGQATVGLLTAALTFGSFFALVGIGQMFVITLGPGNVEILPPAGALLRLAPLGLAAQPLSQNEQGDVVLLLGGENIAAVGSHTHAGQLDPRFLEDLAARAGLDALGVLQMAAG